MEESGLIHCFLFDGSGCGRELGWNEINSWSLSEENTLGALILYSG